MTTLADIRTEWQKFKDNLHRWYAYATAWSAAVWSTVWLYWTTLSDPDKASMVGGFISPAKVPFFIAFCGLLSHFITQGWPQPKLAAKVDAKVEDSKVKALLEAGFDANAGKPMPGQVMTDHGALNSLPSIKS